MFCRHQISPGHFLGKNTRGSKYPVVFHASTSGDEVPATSNHHVAAAEMGAGKGAGVPSSTIRAPRAAWWGWSLPFRGARVQAFFRAFFSPVSAAVTASSCCNQLSCQVLQELPGWAASVSCSQQWPMPNTWGRCRKGWQRWLMRRACLSWASLLWCYLVAVALQQGWSSFLILEELQAFHQSTS